MDHYPGYPPYENYTTSQSQGVIGWCAIAALGIVLCIFFPFLLCPILVIVVLNLICKASEAQDAHNRRRAEMPDESTEPLSGQFHVDPYDQPF